MKLWGRTKPELFSLALYYSMYDAEEDNPEFSDVYYEGVKFFERILAHGFHGHSVDVKVLQNFFESNSEIILKGLLFTNVNIFPFYEWAELFTNAGVDLNSIPSELEHSLENLFYKAGWEKLNKQERDEAVTNAITKYLRSFEHENSGLNMQLEDFHSETSRNKAKTEEEILAILDRDIEILRDLTVNAVIRAIDLERAFISVIVKNVNFIREGITASGDGSVKFDDWISMNVRKVMDSEFARIDRDNMENQTRKSIVAAIQKILNELV